MQSENCTKRRNFSQYEIEALMCCIEKHKDVLENKVTNAITNREKQASWSAIKKEFNSLPGVTKRTDQQLLNLYKNLKRKAAKNKADERLEFFKTGSRLAETSFFHGKSSEIQERLLALGAIPNPLQNTYDSDHHYHETTEKTPGPNCDDVEYEFSDNELRVSMVEIKVEESENAETPRNVPQDVLNGNRFIQCKRKRSFPATSATADAIIKQSTTKTSAITAEDEVNLLQKHEEIEMRRKEHEKKMELMNSQIAFYDALKTRILDRSQPLNISMNINDNIS